MSLNKFIDCNETRLKQVNIQQYKGHGMHKIIALSVIQPL